MTIRRPDFLSRLVATAASVPIVISGHGADRLLAVLGLAPPRLRLPPRVLEDLTTLFGDSIPLTEITIRDGHVPGLHHGRAFALPRLIYLAGGRGTTTVGDPDDDPRVLATPLLVHELVHVWQARHRGWRYVAEALWSQLRHGRRAYEWRWWLARDGGRVESWAELPVEAQAQLVADAYAAGVTSVPAPSHFDDPTVRRVLSEAKSALRCGRRT